MANRALHVVHTFQAKCNIFWTLIDRKLTKLMISLKHLSMKRAVHSGTLLFKRCVQKKTLSVTSFSERPSTPKVLELKQRKMFHHQRNDWMSWYRNYLHWAVQKCKTFYCTVPATSAKIYIFWTSLHFNNTKDYWSIDQCRRYTILMPSCINLYIRFW